MTKKNKILNVFIVGGNVNYLKALAGISDISDKQVRLVSSPIEADLAIFTGGEDVLPKLYGANRAPKTNCNPFRDEIEITFFKYLRFKKIPMLGICRGAQLLTVLSGGKLIQDVDNHAFKGSHKISFSNEVIELLGLKNLKSIPITSTHHQMMYPFNKEWRTYKVLAHSTVKLGEIGEGKYVMSPTEYLNEVPSEPEIVYYPETNCLCIQGHPERQSDDIIVRTLIAQLILVYLFKQKNVSESFRVLNKSSI